MTKKVGKLNMATATSDDVAGVGAIHTRALIIDGRDPSFLTWRQVGDPKTGYWDALRASGLTAVLTDVPWIDDDFKDACVNLGAWHDRVAANSDRALIVRTVEDIRRAKREGKTGIILTSQTPTPIEDDIRLLRPLYELGLRAIQMAYQRRNLLAEGCGEANDGGVSNFGRDAIAEMNRLGIAIDLSHASDRTMLETIEASKEPVFFSHSNARRAVDQKRNVPDETLRKLVAKGGMCCLSAYSDFLVTKGSETGTSAADMARMAKVLVDIIGIEHVGFGLDVGEARTEAELRIIGGISHDVSKRYALPSRSKLLDFTTALAREGFHEGAVEKILGGNLVDFFGRVWKS